MRSLLALPIIPAGVAVAAINPQYALEAQNKAPEVLKVRVVETKAVPIERICALNGFATRVPLKKGSVLYAFLSNIEKTPQGLAARGSSFRADRPELKPIR